MEITKENLQKIFNKELEVNQEEVHLVNIDCIVDAGINPREVDKKYAEQIPLSAPPIILGIVDNDQELKDNLIIIDGNHRMYSYMNVHAVQKCHAIIKRYENRGKAIIDAYRFNINHGKRLTDREISNGIKKTVSFLKNDNNTFNELADMLNMSRTSMSEYVMWDRVETALGEQVDKIKATKLYTLLKDKDNGIKNLRKFYKLNKNLSIRQIKEAIKLFKKTGIIEDYEQYKMREALNREDDFDDGLDEEIKMKPKSISITTENADISDIDIEDDFDEEETTDETPTVKETVITGAEYFQSVEETDLEIEQEEVTENTITESKETEAYTYSPNNTFAEGEAIEINQQKVTKPTVAINDNDKLIAVKGLVRKYDFDTVLQNIFDDLQEDVLNSSNLLEETLNKNLHDNREKFERKKAEYLGVIKNCSDILMKMARKIERANKDLKQ